MQAQDRFSRLVNSSRRMVQKIASAGKAEQSEEEQIQVALAEWSRQAGAKDFIRFLDMQIEMNENMESTHIQNHPVLCFYKGRTQLLRELKVSFLDEWAGQSK